MDRGGLARDRHARSVSAPKKIKLTQGKYALVDAADYEWLSQWKWHYHVTPKDQTGYAFRNQRVSEIPPGATRKRIGMHNVLAGGLHIDHVNGIGTDNRRCNLRKANPYQQMQNRGVQRSNKSCGLKGVSFTRDRKGNAVYCIARITVFGKRIYLGRFDTPAEAARAYEKAAKIYFGEYACSSSRLSLSPGSIKKSA